MSLSYIEEINQFAEAMKDKMRQKEREGYSGWDTCPPDVLRQMLYQHLAKRDPIDIANFAMMLWARGEPL